MYNVARSATVAALTDASVWVLDRATFRAYIQEGAENKINEARHPPALPCPARAQATTRLHPALRRSRCSSTLSRS